MESGCCFMIFLLWSEYPHLPWVNHTVLFLPKAGRTCGLSWPIKASFSWSPLAGGRDTQQEMHLHQLLAYRLNGSSPEGCFTSRFFIKSDGYIFVYLFIHLCMYYLFIWLSSVEMSIPLVAMRMKTLHTTYFPSVYKILPRLGRNGACWCKLASLSATGAQGQGTTSTAPSCTPTLDPRQNPATIQPTLPWRHSRIKKDRYCHPHTLSLSKDQQGKSLPRTSERLYVA